jgi:parallel beta-helix repeat protein
MVIREAAGDGVRVTNGKNLTFRNLNVLWASGQSRAAGAYGIYPVSSENVLIEDCDVRGASDAGIYVGQSMNVVVRNSRAEGNVAGIEIENTDDAEVTGNTAVGNVTGILVFNLPQLVRKTGSRTKVHGNTIESNNIASFAEGGVVSFLPSGAGMVLFANDNAEIHDNTIRTNESTAIVIVACPTVAAISDNGVDCSDAQYDSFPEGIHIHDNTITSNGAAPKGFYATLAAAAQKTPFYDILWDSVVDPSKPASDANKLCIRNNGSASFGAVNLTNLTFTTDLTPHDCSHAALPGVTVTW